MIDIKTLAFIQSLKSACPFIVHSAIQNPYDVSSRTCMFGYIGLVS
jgi:hypothetical protein